MKGRKLYLILAVLSFVIALEIYTDLRQYSFGLFKIYDSYSLIDITSIKKRIPDWVVLSLPDGLWLYSLMLTINAIWVNKNSQSKLVWVSLAYCMAIGLEILQIFDSFPGVFDWVDVLMYTIFYLITISFNKITK